MSPGRFLTHANFGFNVYTYLGATGTKPALNITPADRAIIYEQVGFGYFFHPHFRVQLTMQFGETLTGLPASTSNFTLFGVIPCVMFVNGGFFAGAGPLLAFRAYGINQLDIGIYSASGYAFKLGHGFALAGLVQVIPMLGQRFALAVTPAASLTYRF